MKLDTTRADADDPRMKQLTTWREIAECLGVCVPTARKIVARDRRIRAVVKINGVHPHACAKEVRAAAAGRTIKLPRGKK